MQDKTRDMLRRGIVGTLSLAAAAGTAALAALVAKLEPHAAGRTMFGRAHIVTLPDAEGRPVRLLLIGRSVQSASYTGELRYEPPFAYHRAFDAVLYAPAFESEGDHEVLVLGGGGYAWPKHAISTYEDLRLDVVEVDPAITEIARKWFYLDDLVREFKTNETGRLALIQSDARAYIESCHKRYDAIVSDCYRGLSADASLEDEAAIERIHELLEPGGVFASNVVVGSDYSRLQGLCERLSERFAHVRVLPSTDEHFSDDDNYLVLASDEPFDVEGSFEYGSEE